jgi:hypothetical protein
VNIRFCRCGKSDEPQPVPRLLLGQQDYCAFLYGGYGDAVNVRLREAADQAAAQAFLARHNSLRGARLGELVHPLGYPAFVAETADGQLAGMLTYVPGRTGNSARASPCTRTSSGTGRGPP